MIRATLDFYERDWPYAGSLGFDCSIDTILRSGATGPWFVISVGFETRVLEKMSNLILRLEYDEIHLTAICERNTRQLLEPVSWDWDVCFFHGHIAHGQGVASKLQIESISSKKDGHDLQIESISSKKDGHVEKTDPEAMTFLDFLGKENKLQNVASS